MRIGSLLPLSPAWWDGNIIVQGSVSLSSDLKGIKRSGFRRSQSLFASACDMRPDAFTHFSAIAALDRDTMTAYVKAALANHSQLV